MNRSSDRPKPRLPILSTIFLFLALGCSEGPIGPSTVREASLLWRISGKSLKHPSYLFGTIHAICQTDLFDDAPIRQCLDSAKQLILEIDLRDPKVKEATLAKLTMPASYSLRDYYSEVQYDSIRAFFEASFSLEMPDRAHPFLLTSLITGTFLPCQNRGAYDNVILDLYLRQSIDSLVVGLETIDQQLDLLALDSLAIHARDLYSIIADYNNERMAYGILYNTYLSQDFERLREMCENGDSLFGSHRTLDMRNVAWMDSLPRLMASKPSFIAVGAGHLGGTLGIVQLMRDRGYTMTPISLSPSKSGQSLSKAPVARPISSPKRHLIY